MSLLLARIFVVALSSLLALTSEIATGTDQFDLGSLPPGAQVTLPRAAKILAPVSATVSLTSTDMPQTVSVTPIISDTKKIPSIRLAIFDSRQSRVRYVQVKPGSPMLYSFRRLGTIQIVPQITPTMRTAMNMGQLRLKIESDKPVNVSR